MKHEVIGHLEGSEVLMNLTGFREPKEVARMVRQESTSKEEAEDPDGSGNKSIPPHLKLLFDKSVRERSSEEKEVIKDNYTT